MVAVRPIEPGDRPTVERLQVELWGAAYSVSQIIVFFWRASEPTVLWGLKQAQWTGIVMLAVAVPALIVLWWRYPPSLPTGGEGAEPEESPRATPRGAMA